LTTFKIPKVAFWLSLLFGAALIASVFFQGFYTDFLCLALALLLTWAFWALWIAYRPGLPIPRTGVAICLALYAAWLGVSAAWGAVDYMGAISFWWLGTFPLVFWTYTLSPSRESLWRHGYRWAVLTGVALALYASYEYLRFGLEPSATFLNRQSLAGLLNLVSLPLCGYFLSAGQFPKWQRWGMGAAIFVLGFSLALIEGRGATIAGAMAFLLLLAVAFRFAPKQRVALLVAIVAAAFFIGSQLGKEGLGERLGGVADNPWQAGSTRVVIWKQSWEMVKDAPWMGVGLGHYALYYPRYRDPSDQNAGFFAHNDYLQIWVEAGLPGLLLLIAVLVTVLLAYVRTLRRSIAASQRIELTALFAGLLATAAHSVVDFNLYVLSTMMLAGLVLGRLHELVYPVISGNVYVWVPAKALTPRGYKLLMGLLVGFPLLYILTLGLGSFEYRRGMALVERTGDFDAADAALSRSALFYPFADIAFMSKADLLRHVLSVTANSPQEQRKELFEVADQLLAHAIELNPLRPQNFVVRGFFYEQNPGFLGDAWFDSVVRDYRHALALDPRTYQARYLYARFLIKQHRDAEARRVLEDGMKYFYWPAESMVPYYSLTAAARTEAGDAEGAKELRERARALMEDARARRRARTEAKDYRISPSPLLRSL
jgi:O-antigen ligase